MTRHSLFNQLIAIGLILGASTTILQFGATDQLNWSFVSLITAIILTLGTVFLYQFSSIRLTTVLMMSVELTILLQFWLTRAVDRAMVITLAFWFTNETINIVIQHQKIRFRLVITSLIFAVMFGTIIYTSPVGFEF